MGTLRGMLSFALNHMTVPTLSMTDAADLARALGMSHMELRNDLAQPLFDGQEPRPALLHDLEIAALAEVKAFNAFDGRVLRDAVALMDIAVSCGAKGIALIPQVGGAPVALDGLRRAMAELAPELAARDLIGLIEPIGFENSSLRSKADVVALMDHAPFGAQFGLIHDTFHHALTAGDAIYPAHTKLVHISGVTRTDLAITDFTDADRGLVDADDRLGNTDQIKTLLDGGYRGPFSFECFAPDVHADIDPKTSLSRSITFIEDTVMAQAA